MFINRIHIIQFGALRDRDITVCPGLNIIEGENESGKTTVAAFLRYLFYGTAADAAETVHTERYLPQTGTAGGYIDLVLSAPLRRTDEHLPKNAVAYRISRIRTPDGEVCSIFPLIPAADSTEPVPGQPVFAGEVPGEVFFGVTADVFAASAFVGQIHTGGRTDGARAGSYTGGTPVRAAIDRILCAANESIDPVAAAARLTEQRNALYNPDTDTGSIRELERRRAALVSALESAQTAEREEPEETAESVPDRTDASPQAENPVPAQPDPETEEQNAKTLAAIAACEEKIAAKATRSAQLQKVREQYEMYRSLDDLETLSVLRTQKAAAEKRAAALSSAIFRGSEIPDADFTASLYLCAEDMRAAAEDGAAARAELDKLDFSVRRDNIKETQLHRIALDGGVEVLHSKLDSLYRKRLIMTVFGVFFLLLTVFALATTVFLFLLQAETAKNGILLTALLTASAVFFFVSRSRHERGIGVMLRRYSCTTEDELENFLEEYLLSEKKLQTLTADKEAVSARISEASLRGGEAARQAALLLSRLQPPDTQKITPDRLTPEIVSAAADRIERACAEITRLRDTAARCDDDIAAYLADRGAQSEESLLSRKKALSALFGSKFSIDPILRELDFNLKSTAALQERMDSLRASLIVPPAAPEPIPAPASSRQTLPFTPKKTCDLGPDTQILQSLIAEMDQRLRHDRKTYAALNLAIDAVGRASRNLYETIAPRLTEDAGRLMQLLSDSRYSALTLDETMHVTAADSGDGTQGTVPVDALSAGTQDLAYLSLRMALLRMLYPGELPPLLFDEAFATLDDRRLARMIALLHRAACTEQNGTKATSQALVFTCHKRERRAAEALSGCSCNVLKLK